ncbi:UNVERIFIED_CONTAM: hypothetical protein RMT77_008802 [Armadillidium vulgare]
MKYYFLFFQFFVLWRYSNSHKLNTTQIELPIDHVPVNEAKGSIPYEVQQLPEIITFDASEILSNDCDEINTCVVKCCPEGHLLNYDGKSQGYHCVKSSLFNTIDWESIVETERLILVFHGRPKFELVFKYMDNITCNSYTLEDFIMKEDGSVYHLNQKLTLSQENYCIDKVNKNGKLSIESRICHPSLKTIPFYNQNIAKILIWVVVGLSFFFALIILLLNIISPKHFDLQKKCIVSACVNLFFGFLNLIVSRKVGFQSETGCYSVALVGQFNFLSFYFWFNVTCYEISRIIRGTFKLTPINEMNDSLRRYFAYCIYAWGCPFLITCFTSAMHLIPIEDFPASIRGYIVKPGFAKGRCWFESGLPVFLYYVLFEGLLHVFNAIFMGQAAYLLFQDQIKKVCSRYCCCCCFCFKNNNETQERIRKHASSNHIQTFKIHFIMFFVYLLMLILKVGSPFLSGGQHL